MAFLYGKFECCCHQKRSSEVPHTMEITTMENDVKHVFKIEKIYIHIIIYNIITVLNGIFKIVLIIIFLILCF